MKTLFTVGGMLPCVGIAILLRQIVNKPMDFVPFLVGFTFCASLHLNLVSVTIVSLLFAAIMYEVQMVESKRVTVSDGSIDDDDEEEEDI